MTGRLGLTDVAPVISCGQYPARAAVGERVPISATVFREGHDAVNANVAWRAPDGTKMPYTPMKLGTPGLDDWHASIVPDAEGRWSFVVEVWSDPLGTWWHAVEVKVAAGQGVEELANDLENGARLLERAQREVPK